MTSSWLIGDLRDLYPDLIDLCMKNITQTMFGVYDEELGGIVRALAATCHELVHSVFDVIRPWPFRFPNRLKRQVEKELSDLDRYLGRLIDERSKEPPRDDFLGLLLSGYKGHHAPLSRRAVLDESATLLLAGHETTASALVWSLYLLAQHPQHADALAADLAAHLSGEAPSYGDLDSLELLRATLDETLRLYPATHRIARTVKTPVVIGGHLLSTGADVVMPQWAVHRSARWYQEPEAFKPGRWTPAFRKSLPRFAYFPFSGGARTCVGQPARLVRKCGDPRVAGAALPAYPSRFSAIRAVRRIDVASGCRQAASQNRGQNRNPCSSELHNQECDLFGLHDEIW